MEGKDVFVIHSNSPITKLREELSQCGTVNYMCIIYKMGNGHKHFPKVETNKTIVFCSQETIDTFKKKFPQMPKSVSDYDWSTFPSPSDKYNETWDFHISGMPNDYTTTEAENTIKTMISWLIKEYNTEDNKRNYTINFIPRSRETGQIYGYGILSFSSHVDKEIIKRVKLILHNTPIRSKFSSKKKMISCIWQRQKVEKRSWKKVLNHVVTFSREDEKVMDLTQIQHTMGEKEKISTK